MGKSYGHRNGYRIGMCIRVGPRVRVWLWDGVRKEVSQAASETQPNARRDTGFSLVAFEWLVFCYSND